MVIPLVAYWTLACLGAYHVCGSCQPLAWRMLPIGGATSSTLQLLPILLMNHLAPFLMSMLLIWLAAFDPVRQHRSWVAGLKVTAIGAALTLTVLVIYQEAARAGQSVYVLAQQSHAGPTRLLLANQAPHGILASLCLSAVLVAPLFVLVRSIQVGSVARATFEAWVEVRRRAVPWLSLLVLATLVEAFATPIATAWMLRA